MDGKHRGQARATSQSNKPEQQARATSQNNNPEQHPKKTKTKKTKPQLKAPSTPTPHRKKTPHPVLCRNEQQALIS